MRGWFHNLNIRLRILLYPLPREIVWHIVQAAPRFDRLAVQAHRLSGSILLSSVSASRLWLQSNPDTMRTFGAAIKQLH
jgi:hypothetical protein